MKEYLLKTFRYNDWAFHQLVEKLGAVPDKGEILKLMSHLISAQDKWYNRVKPAVDDSTLEWFGEVYSENVILNKWSASVTHWLDILDAAKEGELDEPVKFKRPSDGKTLSLSLRDLMLQLNYHSIHHRAQINALMSKQGVKPPLTDYIFTVLKEE